VQEEVQTAWVEVSSGDQCCRGLRIKLSVLPIRMAPGLLMPIPVGPRNLPTVKGEEGKEEEVQEETGEEIQEEEASCSSRPRVPV
jgi:hypothetical protein